MGGDEPVEGADVARGHLDRGSVIAGWIAIGRLAAATQRGMARTEESLSIGAQSSPRIPRRRLGSYDMWSALLAKASAARPMRWLRPVRSARSVRGLLDIASIFNRVEDLTDSSDGRPRRRLPWSRSISPRRRAPSRKQCRCSTSHRLAAVDPRRTRRLDRRGRGQQSPDRQQVWLWRLAIVAGGAALLVMLALIALRHSSARCAGATPAISRSTGGRGRGCGRRATPAACAPSTGHRRARP